MNLFGQIKSAPYGVNSKMEANLH